MQAAFAVIQTITKPELMPSSISFIMIGESNTTLFPSAKLFSSVLTQPIAQLLRVALALSISGAVFVNLAVSGLEELLVGRPRLEIQAALLGSSGDFLSALDADQKTQALAISKISFQSVSAIFVAHGIFKVSDKLYHRFIPVYAAAALGVIAASALRVSTSRE